MFRTTTYGLVAALAMTALIGLPAVSPTEAAFALTKSENADLDTAIRATQVAVNKSQGDKAFVEAVMAKKADAIKAILLRNGASKYLSKVVFTGEGGTPSSLPIVVTGRCCPPEIVITIRF